MSITDDWNFIDEYVKCSDEFDFDDFDDLKKKLIEFKFTVDENTQKHMICIKKDCVGDHILKEVSPIYVSRVRVAQLYLTSGFFNERITELMLCRSEAIRECVTFKVKNWRSSTQLNGMVVAFRTLLLVYNYLIENDIHPIKQSEYVNDK